MRLVKNPFSSIQEEIEVVVNEIFYSLQGESSRVGLPTIFIRLTGCPLRCQYCDTEYAFTNGEKVSLKAILNKIKKFPTKYITVTGGEPLAQKSCYKLLTKLCDIGYEVSLETSGAINISNVDKRVKKIVVEHLGVDEDKVTDGASFIDDLGADSLDTVELVMAFEEEFGCEIPDDAAEKILTVKDAMNYIEQIT